MNLIVTIGTRDVVVKKEMAKSILSEEELSYCTNPTYDSWYARRFGEKLLKHKELWKGAELPILTPCLDYLHSNEFKIDSILLVVTNQEELLSEKVSWDDTLYYGQFIKQNLSFFLKKYGWQAKCEILEIKSNVVYLDSMYEFFNTQIHVLEKLRPKDVDSNIALLNQGGIDAINQALFLQSIKLFGRNLIHLSVNQRSKSCSQILFSSQYLEEDIFSKAALLLDHFDYSAVAGMDVPVAVKEIALYANARLHFDFDSALNHLNRIEKHHREFALQQLMQINKLSNSIGEMALIEELYFNARIKFEQQSYVDFLLRFFRILEFLCLKTACELLEIENYDFKTWKKSIEYYFENNLNGQLLKEKLSKEKIDGTDLDFSKPVIPVFIAIIKLFNHPSYPFFKALTVLSYMRNKSIGAHDFKPVSLPLIQEKLSASDFDIDRVFDQLDQLLSLPYKSINPFLQINNQLKKMLMPSSKSFF